MCLRMGAKLEIGSSGWTRTSKPSDYQINEQDFHADLRLAVHHGPNDGKEKRENAPEIDKTNRTLTLFRAIR